MLFTRLRLLLMIFITSVLGFLPLVISSSYDKPDKQTGHHNITHNSIDQKFNSNLLFQITLHGFLLWTSMGFFMPLGILVIRLNNGKQCAKRHKLLFYIHLVFQMTSVLLAVAGAVLSIKSFENTFNNSHQRIGLALYVVIVLQPLIGFCRPHRGAEGRSIWYFVHWVLGTGVCILGITSIYTGLHAYHIKTSKNVKLWSLLFSTEVFLIAFLYLFQDRWEHLKQQGIILGDEPLITNDQVTSRRDNLKDLLRL